MTGCHLHSPSGRKRKIRYYGGAILRKMIDVEWLEEVGVLVERVTPPQIPTTGTTLRWMAERVERLESPSLQCNASPATEFDRNARGSDTPTDLMLNVDSRSRFALFATKPIE